MNYIRTSEREWLKNTLLHLTDKTPFTLVDDASIGLKAEDLQSGINLITAVYHRGLPWTEIALLLASLGVCGFGVALIAVAVVDPEPTTKFGCLLVGGVVLIFTGSLSILATLGLRWSIRIKYDGSGYLFEANPA